MVREKASSDGHATRPASPPVSSHRVVVVGGGFGGLQAVKALHGAPVEVTLVDRNNYHLFQPLTYQVAAGALSPDEIAKPLRTIFRRAHNVRVLMAEVTSFDLENRTVFIRPVPPGLRPQTIPYDTLVVAGGSNYAYFGHDDWRQLTLEVKSLDQALGARARILAAFEAAELETDPQARASWLTFTVIGGGSTGVEMAGQIAELASDTLPGDFRGMEPGAGRVLLVEQEDRVLPSFPPSLSKRAAGSLNELGVTLLTGRTVVGIGPDQVRVQSRDRATELATRTVVWAAGVSASPLARALAEASGTNVDRAGRATVEPDLTVPGHPEVIALGDMVRVRDARTGAPRVLPGVAPVAMQQGRYAGRMIRGRLQGSAPTPFRYRDKGSLATIGRSRAVADLPGIRIGGLPAWMLWLAVHLIYLIGFENRLVVLVRWAYNFLTHGRGARSITQLLERSTEDTSLPLAGARSGE